MLWNELSWEMQKHVLAKLEEKLLEETDIPTQDAMVAAIQELEMWSHNPCPIIGNDEGEMLALAVDGGWDDIDF